MNGNENNSHITTIQQTAMIFLRVAIGWHFAREGWVKLMHPTWSADGYLLGSWGPLSSLFHAIANVTVGDTPLLGWTIHDPAVAEFHWMLAVANALIPWMLFLAGVGLMVGCLTRTSIATALLLLCLFYVAAPPIEMTIPFSGDNGKTVITAVNYAQWAGKHLPNSEGNYIWVNKNLVEGLALILLLTFDTGKLCGLDAVIRSWNVGRFMAHWTESRAAKRKDSSCN